MASLFRDTRGVSSKTITIARTNTTAFEALKIPKGSRILAIVSNSTLESNAQTTATISVGTTATANEWISAADVKTTASGKGSVLLNGTGTPGGVPLTVDATIYAKYAETGTASTTGGPWRVTIFFNPGYAQINS